MLLLFIGYVGCRNYEPALPEEILGSDGLFYIVAPKKNLKDRVCDHKEQLMFLGGILFFGYIGLKLVTSFYRGMKAKNSIKKKKQA